MNASGEFLKSASHGSLMGLPVCDLGWNASLGLAESLVSLRGARTTLSFLDETTLIRQAASLNFRRSLNGHLLLPAGGRLFRLFGRMARGKSATAWFSARTFVPALLTFIEKSCHIAIVGEDPTRVEAMRQHFARHSPWHTVVALAPGHLPHQHFDVVLIDARNAAEERRIERSIAALSAGLVVMAGAGLSQFAKSGQVASNSVQPKPSFA